VIKEERHSITSRYVHTADAVLLAAVAAVADKILNLMRPPNFKSELDQAQLRLRSDRPDIGSAVWDEFTSL
jgi:hypothetical protein